MRLIAAWHLFRHLGFGWAAYRVKHALQNRVHWFERVLPVSTWEQQPLAPFLLDGTLAEPSAYLRGRQKENPHFFFSTVQRPEFACLLANLDGGNGRAVSIAERIGEGEFRYFEHQAFQTGFPPDWQADPRNGERVPADRHWSRIESFGSSDIKVIWEASRFAFTYPLVRAYWRTGDERFAEAFWRLVEDWRVKNPPQCGVNWKCGQEASFRVMAWCFGLYGFLDAMPSTPERVTKLAQVLAVTGQRIAAHVDYALSMSNNHGVSEGLGLWTLGTLFPEFRSAQKWKAKGRDILESLGRTLIYADGSFSQHSVNYHRLMLHDYLWVIRLGDLNECPFSDELRERVRQAGDFLYQIQDQISGRVPCYGPNDGALILPLNNCDYQDFRPVTQAAKYLTGETRFHASGPWDEDLLWLFGPSALRAPVHATPRRDFQANDGGYYTLRNEDGFVFARCATFRHRPGQADMLHVDIWWRGQNVALDAGTYSYNAPPPWNDPFSHTEYHNTVIVDGHDQMVREGRFLWLPWLRSRMRALRRSDLGALAYWEGEHNAYDRLDSPVGHRRAVVQSGRHAWIILDRLMGAEAHDYRLHWLLPALKQPATEVSDGHMLLHFAEGDYHVRVATTAQQWKTSLVCADTSSARGWRAPYYQFREPALSLSLMAHDLTCWFWSCFSPRPCECRMVGESLHFIGADWEAHLQLNISEDPSSLVKGISLTGDTDDEMVLLA